MKKQGNDLNLLEWLAEFSKRIAFSAFYLMVAFALVVSLAVERLPGVLLPYSLVVFLVLVFMALLVVKDEVKCKTGKYTGRNRRRYSKSR